MTPATVKPTHQVVLLVIEATVMMDLKRLIFQTEKKP